MDEVHMHADAGLMHGISQGAAKTLDMVGSPMRRGRRIRVEGPAAAQRVA